MPRPVGTGAAAAYEKALGVAVHWLDIPWVHLHGPTYDRPMFNEQHEYDGRPDLYGLYFPDKENPDTLAQLVTLAETDPDAYYVLVRMLYLDTRKGPLPPEKDRLFQRILGIGNESPITPPARRRGEKLGQLRNRDVRITKAIQAVLDLNLGFTATRNDATEAPSACSIVTDALNKKLGVEITERAVKEVWQKGLK